MINENSQAAKNEMICATLKKVVEPMGHEVFNYGMRGASLCGEFRLGRRTEFTVYL